MPRCKIGLVDRIHCRVVAFEMGEIDAREHYLVEPTADACQDAPKIFDYPARLPLDSLRQRRAVVVRIGRDLPGDEDPAVRCGRMAVRCHWLGAPGTIRNSIMTAV